MTGEWLAAELIWADDQDAAPDSEVRLHATHCLSCGRSSFPDVGSCSWCGAFELEPRPLAAAIAVAATAVLHPTPGAVVETPYVVILARFDDAGLDVLGRVRIAADQTAVPPGTPMRVVSEALPDGRRHYAFAPER
jgi:uncharacterized OB-fold protein